MGPDQITVSRHGHPYRILIPLPATEIQRSPEEVGALMTGTRTRLEQAIRSQFIPRPCQIQLMSALRRIRVLEDDEFFKHFSRGANPLNSPEIARVLMARMERSISFFMPPIFPGSKPYTIIRSRVLEITPFPNLLAHLVSEELGHSLSHRRKKALDKVEDGSFLLQPHDSVEELMEILNNTREQFGIDREIVPRDIELILWGFRVSFRYKPRNIIIANTWATEVAEEARAAIIQVILEIALYGKESFGRTTRGKATPEVIYQEGIRALHDLFQSPFNIELECYNKEQAALTFLLSLIDFYQQQSCNLIESIHNILDLLFRYDFKQLNHFLRGDDGLTASYSEFLRSLNVIARRMREETEES